MSAWMQLLSEMKRRPSDDYLTPTQQKVRDNICEWLQFPNRINLVGSYGSGKTYTAWALVRFTGAAHIPVPEMLRELQPEHDVLLIDNAPYFEADVRRLLSKANLLGATSVVLITREPVQLSMRRVALALPEPCEIKEVLKNYSRLGFYQQHELPDNPNFWHIMLACV